MSEDMVTIGCLNLARNPHRRWWQFWKPKLVWVGDLPSAQREMNRIRRAAHDRAALRK